MRDLIAAIATLFLGPIAYLNWVCAISSGIWLLTLGQWKPIWIGIGAFFLSRLLISISMMPGFIFVLPVLLIEKFGKKTGSWFFLFLGGLYGAAIMTVWCLGVFWVFARMAGDRSLLPMMLWAYAVATGPIVRFSKDDVTGKNDFSVIAAVLSITNMVVMLMELLGNPSLQDFVSIFTVVMSVFAFALVVITYSQEWESKIPQ